MCLDFTNKFSCNWKKEREMKKKIADSVTNKIITEKDSEMKQQNCREK